MRKAMTAAALSATLLSGTAIGATIFAPSIVGAQSDPTTTTTTPAGTPEQARSDHLRSTLQPLVDAGTITEAQRDAVIAALEAARPERGAHHGGMFGGHGLRGAVSEAVAGVLGLEPDALRTELRAGKTLADVAAEKGVDVQAVIDAIVSEGSARIDEAVTAGKLTQEQADARKASLAERAADIVNGTPPEPMAGGPRFRQGGMGAGFGANSWGTDQAPAATSA